MKLNIHITRGNKTESIHNAYAVAIDESGSILHSVGDPNYITCIRSSLKPFQASAGIRSGAFEEYNLSNSEIALTCSSHSGEKVHTNLASKILKKINLSVTNYECGAHPAHDTHTRHNMLISHKKYSALHNNCSGKHAGMLCVAQHINKTTKDYIKPNHPVQKYIKQQITHYAETNAIEYGVDGCSLPVPFYTLQTIAKMYQKIGSTTDPVMKQIFNAMSNNSYLIGGKKRFDTEFISALQGRGVAKGGGEAIQGITLITKKHGPIGIALKILDGSYRARAAATMKFLIHFNLLSDIEIEQLKQYNKTLLYNHNKIVIGHIEAVIE